MLKIILSTLLLFISSLVNIVTIIEVNVEKKYFFQTILVTQILNFTQNSNTVGANNAHVSGGLIVFPQFVVIFCKKLPTM